MPDSLASCQVGIGFIMRRGKSKQSHRMAADEFGMQLHSLSKDSIDNGILSPCGSGSSSNSGNATMVHSSFDLVDTSTFCKKQNNQDTIAQERARFLMSIAPSLSLFAMFHCFC